MIYFDLETTAIAPMATDFPEFVVMGYMRDERVFEYCQSRAESRAIIDRALADGELLVGHNLAFDLGVLGYTTRELEHARIHDTMVIDLLQRLARHDCSREKPGPPKLARLDSLAARRLDGKGTTQLSFRPGVELTQDQLMYLAGDIECLPVICDRQRRRDIPGGYQLVLRQVQSNIALMRLGFNGIRVDRAEIKRQREIASREMRAAARVLQQHGVYEPARIGKKGGRYKAKTNMKELKKHVVATCEKNDIKVVRTDKNNIKTDKAFLSTLPQTEIITNYLEYKNFEKIKNTFLKAWDTEHGRIYPKYRGMMRTGRTGCGGPNLQQIPSRGKRGELKRVFLPEEGTQFYELDYGTLELCVLAELTKGRMQEMINKGADLHRYLAGVYYGKDESDVTKEERQLMKCFHPDVEFLTPWGWKKFDDLNGDHILQAEPVPGGDPILSWARPFNLFDKQAEELVHVKNKSIDIMVTPDHRMLVGTARGNPVVCSPEQMSTRRYIWGAGQMPGNLSENETLLRLAVATAADGSYAGHKITFGFTKRRKAKRLITLCRSAGYTVSQRTDKNGIIRFCLPCKLSAEIKALLDGKKFDWLWMELLLSEKRAIIDEAQYWDGSKSSPRAYSFSSTERQNIDVLAAVAISCGHRAREGEPLLRKDKKHRTCYNLAIYDRAKARAGSIETRRVKYNGRVVCLSVPSSFVIVRSRGTICTYGQCANFGLPGGMGQEKFRQFIRSNGLPDPGERRAVDLKNAWLAAFPEMEDWLKSESCFSPWVLQAFREKQDWTDGMWAEVERRYDTLVEDGYHLPAWVGRAVDEQRPSYGLLRWLEHKHVTIRRGHTRRPVSYTEQRNTRFQGLAALLCKRALALLIDTEDITINAFVHDSVLISCREFEQAEAAAHIMLSAGKDYLPGTRVSVDIAGPGENWYEAKTAGEKTLALI